jgi:hypothetical protein
VEVNLVAGGGFTLPLRRGWNWRDTKRNSLFLSTPRLIFNPPVLKENLQKGSG